LDRLLVARAKAKAEASRIFCFGQKKIEFIKKEGMGRIDIRNSNAVLKAVMSFIAQPLITANGLKPRSKRGTHIIVSAL